VTVKLQQRIVNSFIDSYRDGCVCLSGPIDIILAFHNAFRRDIFQIDDSVFKIARSGGDLAAVLSRLHVMNEILDYHARGEEAAVFPAVDKVAPLVAKAYLMDHRELDIMVNALEVMREMPDPLSTARATAVLRSHLRIHLDKEDAHLYKILRERTTVSEQAAIAGLMSKQVPPAKFPTMVQWLFPLLDLKDQIVVTEGWKTLMPPQVFSGVKQLIKSNAAVNWDELQRQIPDL
jgi:iron-sulfur cluster repair protein YtfE (RIC family)